MFTLVNKASRVGWIAILLTTTYGQLSRADDGANVIGRAQDLCTAFNKERSEAEKTDSKRRISPTFR